MVNKLPGIYPPNSLDELGYYFIFVSSEKDGAFMALGQDLQTEKISHLDLSDFALVRSQSTLAEALEAMRREPTSCVLVEDGRGKLAGIFTERDVLVKVVDAPSLWGLPVDGFMTVEPETVLPDDPVEKALRMMNAGHYRHVPVLDEEGKIVGTVTHSILIRFLTDRFPREIYNLPPDPQLIPNTREGA